MALLASGSPHSFPSTSRDAVGYSPSSSTSTDRFLHITGEVTNPVLLENFIVEHPMVHSAIMFGHGRYNAGVLIDLEDGYKIDTNDAKQVEETRNKLQVVIERMNMFAPQHARVQKEMILFAAPAKPFIYAPLSSARVNRRDTLAKYNDGINALYDTIARAARIALKPPRIWSPQNSLTYVRGIIVAVLGKKLDDDADLFNYGTDSLQATRIRIILFRALQSTAKADTRKLSGNIVYQYPTITGLATFATRTTLACFRHRTESSLARCLEMTKMVQSYTLDFPKHQPSMPPPHDDVVLITGTTGLFGSNLLAQFVQSPKVARVYALNRRKSRPGSVVERQAALLQASGLEPALAHHPKLTFLEADATRSHLGLPQELYEQLLSSVTHLVHNAWLSTYDDHLPLSIFDGSLRMLRNLVNFALSSPLPVPPRLMFISSTDAVRGTSEGSSKATSEKEEAGGPAAPEGPVGACDAAGGAYGESKWVGEQILAAAASETPLRPIIIRVGPLCGAANGRWREEAHFPMIVHLGVTLGALPKIDEVVHWIPVHTAAQAVAEMRNAQSTYLHVTHPLPVSSLTLLRTLSDQLHLPLIPLSQWTTKLETHVHTTTLPVSSSKLEEDPALTLLRHVEHARDPTATDAVLTRIFNHVRVASGEAWFASPTLHGGVSALGIEDVRLWLRHWREVGLIA
ncbi:NAD(P)-binding protein [Imleria badia]|nr:NAD(P)-binding protein [Imleria badia]